MKRRYHLKQREPRWLDLDDYRPLLDVVMKPKRPSLFERFINWLLGKG